MYGYKKIFYRIIFCLTFFLWIMYSMIVYIQTYTKIVTIEMFETLMEKLVF